jgi:hypothetical protein
MCVILPKALKRYRISYLSFARLAGFPRYKVTFWELESTKRHIGVFQVRVVPVVPMFGGVSMNCFPPLKKPRERRPGGARRPGRQRAVPIADGGDSVVDTSEPSLGGGSGPGSSHSSDDGGLGPVLDGVIDMAARRRVARRKPVSGASGSGGGDGGGAPPLPPPPPSEDEGSVRSVAVGKIPSVEIHGGAAWRMYHLL